MHYQFYKNAAGGGERPLGEKLPNGFEFKSAWGDTYKLTGRAIELHRLAVEDFDQLERRADEIKEENINATCSFVDRPYKEVRQAPLQNSSPGHSTIPRLLVQCLGLGAPAAQQGRRSQQGRKMENCN